MQTTLAPSRLVVCPDCGGQVSRSADACPHCGFRHRAPPTTGVWTITRGVFWGLVLWSLIPAVLAFLFLASIGAALSGASGSSPY